MNVNLIKKAIQSPEVVRLMYCAIGMDFGPLSICGTGLLPDSGYKYAIVLHEDDDKALCAAAVYDNIAMCVWSLARLSEKELTVCDPWTALPMAAVILRGGNISSSRFHASNFYQEYHFNKKVGPLLLVYPDVEEPINAPPDIVEMIQLFRGESITPVTELGLAIKGLDETLENIC